MKHLNLHLASDFVLDLRTFMRVRKIANKSDAVRSALREVVSTIEKGEVAENLSKLLGVGASEVKERKPRFASDDALWERD